MELAPVFQQDTLITDQVVLPMQQTQKSVSYNNNNDNNENVYLASRHQVRATQVSSLQTVLFRESRV